MIVNNIKVYPVVHYCNIEINKRYIIKINKNVSGIYLWYNNHTNEFYIGSTKNLGIRLQNYFSVGYLKRVLLKSNSLISSALLKYGYSKFDLYILEFCSIKSLSEREQYFIDYLNPKYNILRKVGIRSDTKCSIRTFKKY
jgi:group I intron endonuclease